MPSQPDDQSWKILKIAIIVTVALCVLTLCAVVVMCMGPFALFAWLTDRQMDWIEEQSGTAPFLFG